MHPKLPLNPLGFNMALMVCSDKVAWSKKICRPLLGSSVAWDKYPESLTPPAELGSFANLRAPLTSIFSSLPTEADGTELELEDLRISASLVEVPKKI